MVDAMQEPRKDEYYRVNKYKIFESAESYSIKTIHIWFKQYRINNVNDINQ